MTVQEGDQVEQPVVPVSIVIAAHNEEFVITRCLDALTEGTQPGEFEVIVVCNGCSDATAELAARACPDAKILDLLVASKVAALNAGDEVATRFPRLYIDADVEVPSAAIRAAARELAAGTYLCVGPALQFEVEGRPWVVRKFYEVWQQLPYLQDEVVGNGAYGMSAEGRARFGAFPEIIADDQFVLQQFTGAERHALRDHPALVHTPRTVLDLVRHPRSRLPRHEGARGAGSGRLPTGRRLGPRRCSASCASPRTSRASSPTSGWRCRRGPGRWSWTGNGSAITAPGRRVADGARRSRGIRRVSARRARRQDSALAAARVVYVVTHYPLISHAFILREVVALRHLGVAVEMFAIHKAVPEEVLTEQDASEAAATTSVLPLGFVPLVRAHLHAFLRSPGAYVKTLEYALAEAPRGAKARLWQLFYFAEAVVVWSGCARRGVHHLHVHLANAGADVAWLACELGRRIDPSTPWHWSFTMHGCIEFFEVSRFNLVRKVSASELVVCISDFTRGAAHGALRPS